MEDLNYLMFADDLILFAEASVAQIRIIRTVLQKFCVASGEKVSLDKLKIFFSGNVSRDMAKLISEESGIPSTRELGKYLGMPILQKRINKDTFTDVLEKVSTRLSGWKGRFLSMAGRLTLTKAVLSSIPVHIMGVISLPKTSLDKLDRVSRDFFWGSSTEQRKQHLVSWQRVCTPKVEGGLGIRTAREMNMALISKLGWRLLKERTSLWSCVLRHKYKVGEVHDRTWTMTRSNASSTWRSILSGLREVVLPGVSWVIGDGREIRFWSDKWLLQEALSEVARVDLPMGFAEIKARDMWRNGRGWDLTRIMPYVEDSMRLRLAPVVLDDVTGAKDGLSWGGDAARKFTVQSAYALFTRNPAPRQQVGELFNRLWRTVVPERVKLFMWLAMNQVLMTNVERHQRHLCDSNICPVCKSGQETILHILRECPAMAGIWQRIVLMRQRRSFFSNTLLEWLYENLGDCREVEGSRWSTIYAMTIWWAWKWRCGDIFDMNKKCRDKVRFVKELEREVTKSHQKLTVTKSGGVRIDRLIAWVPPQEGWLKLNTDGGSHGNPGVATAGGVIRDVNGIWGGGFAVNIGICTAPLAELWGVYYGLFLAWERRARRVELEVDSQIVVGFLTTGISDSHPLSFLVRLCYGFLSKDWIVRVSHVYREANRLVDGLANYAFTLPLGFHLFGSAPDCVTPILLEDANGVSRIRNVRL